MREADEQRRRVAAGSRAPAPDATTTPPPSSSWHFDFARTARLCAYSALLGTPIAHYWFGLLDKGLLLPAAARAASAGLYGAACKTLLDQLFMAPVGLTLFFSSVALMEGKTLPEAAASATARLKPALIANYSLWPGAQALNFALVPPRQRILYVNVVAIFWTAVLSHLASAEMVEGGGGAGESAEGAKAAAAAAAKEAEATQPHPHHHHHHLPLPVPSDPTAAAAVAAAAAGGVRRRGAAGRAEARQKQQQGPASASSDDETPPDTFVPVVP
jgi:hypothetical protein